MLELVEKYFQSDLTEPEMEQLSRALLDSEESALLFEFLARETYLSFGLPEPQSQGPRPPLGGPGTWMGAVVLLVGLGLAAFLGRYHGGSPALAGSVGPKTMAGAAQVAAPKDPAHSLSGLRPVPAMNKGTAASDPDPSVAAYSRQRVPGDPQMGRSSDPGPGAKIGDKGHQFPANPSTPIDLDANPGRTFSGISVQVSQAKAGPLSVRVLDRDGREVTPLYQGILGPGNWAFEWDGQLLGGKKAEPGFYRIEVRSGAFVQYKKIQIQ